MKKRKTIPEDGLYPFAKHRIFLKKKNRQEKTPKKKKPDMTEIFVEIIQNTMPTVNIMMLSIKDCMDSIVARMSEFP